MKKFLWVIIGIIALTPFSTYRNVEAEYFFTNESDTPDVLCLPGIYSNNPGDCRPSGPSQYLTELAALGISFPLIPLSSKSPDPALAEIDVNYAEVITPNAPVYASMAEAVVGNKQSAARKLSGETVYISYTSQEEVEGKKLYMIDQGAWMRGADISRIGVIPLFQGLLFDETPKSDFGWILTFFAPSPQVESKRSPGYQGDDYSGNLFDLYEVVQIFSEEIIDEETWYMIAPDEWIPKKYVARVRVNTSSPEGISEDRWIDINLFDQTIAVYDQRKLVFATVVATGVEPLWTQPGIFQIYEKHETTYMAGALGSDGADSYYLEDVPWTMYFDQARALHGAYWRTKMGFEQSHGCVNLTPGDAHWLFDWANIGDWVHVWDPSGLTPTDPALYGSGGF
jgi:hypothetical protein